MEGARRVLVPFREVSLEVPLEVLTLGLGAQS